MREERGVAEMLRLLVFSKLQVWAPFDFAQDRPVAGLNMQDYGRSRFTL
jgi:hypothetical protein